MYFDDNCGYIIILFFLGGRGVNSPLASGSENLAVWLRRPVPIRVQLIWSYETDTNLYLVHDSNRTDTEIGINRYATDTKELV